MEARRSAGAPHRRVLGGNNLLLNIKNCVPHSPRRHPPSSCSAASASSSSSSTICTLHLAIRYARQHGPLIVVVAHVAEGRGG